MVQKTHEMFLVAAPYVVTALVTLSTALLSVLLWVGGEKNDQLRSINSAVNEIETDIAVMKGNRFTSDDGQAVWREIAALRSDIPAEVPPLWFKQQVDGISEDVVSNSDKIDVIKQTVTETQAQLTIVNASLARIETKLP